MQASDMYVGNLLIVIKQTNASMLYELCIKACLAKRKMSVLVGHVKVRLPVSN